MFSPLVSVIIPTYNRATYLKEAVDSVANQSYPKIEILVVDDGSEVNYAEEICRNYKNCTYIYKKNGGLSSARNYGVANSKGLYIAFLDDDDFWKEDKIEKQVAILETNTEVDLVHSSASVVDIDGKETGKIIGATPQNAHKRSGNVFWNALGVWVVKSPTPMIRKEVFQPDLLFDETIGVGEDIDFYQRLFYRHKVYYIDEPLAFYRVFEDANRLSLQRQKYMGIEYKMIANFKKMGIKNFLTLHKIAMKLVPQAISNWNLAFPNATKELNYFKLYLRPIQYLKSFESKPCA